MVRIVISDWGKKKAKKRPSDTLHLWPSAHVGGVGLVSVLFIKKRAQSTYVWCWGTVVGVGKICSTRAVYTHLRLVLVFMKFLKLNVSPPEH